jgi:LacI family transcriptional regulator
MGVTIKQIAADLKLAVSTVSKALGDSHEISPETKARVFDYAAKLNYTPNPYARSLKRRLTGNIAVVLPEVSDSFFSSAIDGIEAVAQQKGYHVMVYLTHEDAKREQSIIREFRNGRVDGVLMSVVSTENQPAHLLELGASATPLVFFDRVYEEMKAANVVTNDFESGYNAAVHLIEKGCKQLCFLSVEGNLAIIRHRQEGFEKALLDYQRESVKHHIVNCSNDERSNLALLRKLFQKKNRPDGIVGSVEKVATQVYSVCHELNLSIPKDVKVIAFSNLQIASLLNPSMTTIAQPAFEMGKMAATLLFRALEKKIDLKHERVVINSTLIERGSTASKKK